MNSPKIALFDIETAPSLGYFWGNLYETSIIDVTKPWYMLCFSYKWLGEKEIHTHAICDYPRFKKNKEDDKNLIEELHRVFDRADVLVAHNGDGFDIRKTNARFIIQGLRPPSPYKTIDTLKAARKFFKFESNKLNDLGQYLGVGRKIPHTGFALWRAAMEGDNKAWDKMRAYNKRDVELLELVYNRLRPYMSNHPKLNVYTGNPGCPTCQSHRTMRRGVAVSRVRRYRRYQCNDCGSWFQGDLIKNVD
jgi:DNA polymerase elongation subunit (family B)